MIDLDSGTPAVPGSIDLNSPPRKHRWSARLDPEETRGERAVRLFKDVVLFLVAIAFVAMVVWLCYATIDSATASEEEKKWAMSVISAATGGIIGYLVKK